MGRGAGRGVPDGRTCVGRGARRKPCRALWLLVAAVHGAVSTGCSLIHTKGPQPEVQPPPPCETSNNLPVADTVLAVASVGAVVAGSVVYSQNAHKSCGFDFGCAMTPGAGIGLVVAGGVGTLVFVPSAIVGFMRTADCRAWLQANPQYAPPPSPPPPSPPPPPAETSSSLLVPVRTCPIQGDAPLLCSSRASWESSALVLNASSGGAP